VVQAAKNPKVWFRRVQIYEQAFYDSLRKTIRKYGGLAHVVPGYLKGPKRIVVFVCKDGIVVGHNPSIVQRDTVEFNDRQDRTVQEALNALLGSDRIVRIAPNVNLEMADCTILGVDPKTGEERRLGPLFERIELSASFSADRWNRERGIFDGSTSVVGFVVARALGLPVEPSSKPNLPVSRLESLVNDFEALLDSDPNEETVQQFLAANPILLCPSAAKVRPKVGLGAEHKTDFVVELPELDYVLVELELPGSPLFTQKGDPSAGLTHGRKQVEDWLQWVHEHLSYVRETLPGLNAPDCWVIIGRSRDLSQSNRRSLSRMNAEQAHITILTYDELLDRVRGFISNLKRLS
jgi:hypothetical protein